MRGLVALSAVATALVATTVARAQTPPPSAPLPAATSGDEGGVGPLMGRVFAYVRAPLRDAPLEQASTSAWLELRPHLGPSYAKVSVSADTFATSIDGAPNLRAHVREGYVGIGNDAFDFRVGQQIIPWGNADAINPLDLLSARDFTFFSADPEANRLGVLSARVSWTPIRSLSFVVVGTPVAPVSTLLLPPALIPPGVTLHSVQQPTATLGNAEEAARVVVTGDGWDFALLGFRGWNHTPELDLLGSQPNGTIDVGLTQHRYLAAGAEGSIALSKWVLRAQSAYVSTENADGSNPLIQPSHWDSVVGVERSFFDKRVRVQAQGITRFHPQYTAPAAVAGPDPRTTMVDAALAQANAILEDYVTQLRVAASVRVAYTTSDDKLAAEVFALANLNDGHDFLLRPLVGYRATDALKLEVGAEIYGGSGTSPLGALNDYSGAFAQATYQF